MNVTFRETASSGICFSSDPQDICFVCWVLGKGFIYLDMLAELYVCPFFLDIFYRLLQQDLDNKNRDLETDGRSELSDYPLNSAA